MMDAEWSRRSLMLVEYALFMRAKKHSSVIERRAFDRISRPTASSSKPAGEAPVEEVGVPVEVDVPVAVSLIFFILRRGRW